MRHDESIDDDFFSADDAAAADHAAGTGAPTPVPPRLGLLARLDPREFDVVARAAKLQFFEAGTAIFRQGDEAHRFFILVDGAVRVERDGQLLARLGDGSFFGESALMLHTRRTATVTVERPSSVWSVDYAAFEAVVSRSLLDDERAHSEVMQRIDDTPARHFLP